MSIRFDAESNLNTNTNTTKKNHMVIFKIPSLCEMNTTSLKKYKVNELKQICKSYKIHKFSKMKKQDLINSIENLVNQNKYIVFIQKNVRRFILERFLNKKSPNKSWLPSKRRELCKNTSDFYTLEPIDEIPLSQYICYVDENKCYWGFNIISLYNYYKHQYAIYKKKNMLKNPYTGLPFCNNFILLLNEHVIKSPYYGLDVDLNIEENEPTNTMTNDALLLNVLTIIEQHGYLIRKEWVSNIPKEELITFLNELEDIWIYRSQTSMIIKRQICHPSGNPFESLNISNLTNETYDIVLKNTLTIILNIISKGVSYSDCCTGILFVLSAFTLVSDDIANAYEWLFIGAVY